MKATLIHGAGDIRVEHVPDPELVEPTDAIVRVVRAAICGSDLWPYASAPVDEAGAPIGHEFIGVVEDVGAEVTGVAAGDLVVAPFTFADGTCEYCREGLHTACPNRGVFGTRGAGGGQADAVRVPLATGTLVKLPVAADSELLGSLLTLADVFSTGHHAAVTAGVLAGDSVTVVGDGAVGLSAVLAAKRLGAEQIVLMGHHRNRTDLGREFGATDVVAERGDEGVAKVRDLTKGQGTRRVLECVGLLPALETAEGVARAGGVISRVGVPQYTDGPIGFAAMFGANLTLTGGPAPARAYIETLLPDVLDGTIAPGRVFDRAVDLDGVPEGYQAMADRQALKVLVTP
ncbi:alcohol dehydrogenase catalytic domain-containing protein [Actinomycetospora sp. TBRC 11914]|uniref:alcohol dehydrogenase catalytic domain-containing protein n=1 Tax=Actinomycetospora sp. TBRC 11914 TaxID=2729387 RepID=UPI00145D025C|nr:alcohol dehydrogenase catalytic domain-containing protein [Actinomycetospora sp. TBRC 11914]NMO90602.1 alcohol dehydrogenase catalytic domain-containing protein [Actinomycetospora sp. TBRC 11914]